MVIRHYKHGYMEMRDRENWWVFLEEGFLGAFRTLLEAEKAYHSWYAE